MYLSEKLSAHCTQNVEFLRCTADYKIICLDITKPGLKYMTIICP